MSCRRRRVSSAKFEFEWDGPLSQIMQQIYMMGYDINFHTRVYASDIWKGYPFTYGTCQIMTGRMYMMGHQINSRKIANDTEIKN